MKAPTIRTVILASFLALLLMAPGLNPEEEFARLLQWEAPKDYPRPTLEGMDIDTLSIMLDAGNLQWYEPRPEPEKWEAVVGLKVHTPAEQVWEVITDYPALCEIMPLTYLACETEYRDGNTVKNNQKGQTTIIRFAYKYDIIDIVHEDPPYHHHVNTIEGLENRELDVILVPVKNNTETLLFMRYYLNMAALGLSMQAMLAIMPMTEPPTAVGAANYHSRAYKNLAEKRFGYKPAPQPGQLQVEKLDLKTLRIIDDKGGGMIRETPEGEIIDALGFEFIDASPEIVWDTITDFDHYSDVYIGAEMEVISREGNQVEVLQRSPSTSVFIFQIEGFEFPARYTLNPPYELSYYAYEGMYEGSHGKYRILPVDGGKRTLLFHVAGMNLDRDNSLTARIFKSGAFPLKNMLLVLGAQSTLERVREAAEKRAKGA